jgi:ATP/maltotriose-dependent transcriptional regulator MalT
MGNPVALSEAAANLSREQAYLRDAENALHWAGQAVEAAEQASSVSHQVYAALALAGTCILRGDAAQARSGVEAAEQVAGKAGLEVTSPVFGGMAYNAVPGAVSIFLGEWDKAEPALLQALEESEQFHRRAPAQIWINPALGWLYLERGDLAAAKAHLGESVAYCQAAGDKPPELHARVLLAQVCCEAGDLKEATEHLGRAGEIFSLSLDWRGLAAEVHHAQGILATAQRRWPEAEAAFQKAVEINRQYHLPYFQARSLLEWGEMCLARNAAADRQQGMLLLDQALSIFQRVQAKKMVEKVLARQQSIASPPPADPALPGGLTQRELEVLRLIALGRSNREIAQELVISLNTVGHHVSNILSKTGAPNRAGIATYAARHGLLS